MSRRLIKLSDKRKRDEDEGDGNEAAFKRHKPDEDVEKVACRAMVSIDAMDKFAPEWKTNLNRWQLPHDPVFEANRLLAPRILTGHEGTAHCVIKWGAPGQVSAVNEVLPFDPAGMGHLPPFGGNVGELHYLLTPPLECLIGPLYVSRLFTAMKFVSRHCVSLINEYYDPSCRFDLFTVQDIRVLGEPIRRLYIRQWIHSLAKDEAARARMAGQFRAIHGVEQVAALNGVDVPFVLAFPDLTLKSAGF